MAKHTDRVRIEEVDWQAVFPWVRLLGAFKMAVHPGKLLTSLLLIVLLYLVALVADPITGHLVHPGELAYYRAVQDGLITPEGFDAYFQKREERERDALRQLLTSTPGFKADVDAIIGPEDRLPKARQALLDHYTKAYADIEIDRKETGFEKDWEKDYQTLRSARGRVLAQVDALMPRQPLQVATGEAVGALDRLARSLVTFNFGFTQAVQANPHINVNLSESAAEGESPLPASEVLLPLHDPSTSHAALRDLFVIIPGWLWQHHRLPLLLWLLISLPLVAVLGGSVARMAAMQATRDERISLREAMRFVLPRWWAFALTPLVPLLIVAAVALLMGLGGFVMFNPPAWGIDIIAGLLFGIAILCGFIIVATLTLTAMGIHLVYPATAVNGSDVFDAIARAFNYVLNRPWRWLFYNTLALFYGAVTYLFLYLVIMLIFWATQRFTGQWVFTTTDLGVNRFETLLPADGFLSEHSSVDYASLDWSGRISAFLVHCWMGLLACLLPAFLLSYYLSANTWIYTLLRKDADGIELEDVLIDPPYDPTAPAKVAEPAEAATADDDDDAEE